MSTTLSQSVDLINIFREQVLGHPWLAFGAFLLGVMMWAITMYGLLRLIVRLFRRRKASPQPEPDIQPERLSEAQQMLKTFRLLAEHGYTVVKVDQP